MKHLPKLTMTLALLLLLSLAAGCSGSGGDEPAAEDNDSQAEDHDEEEDDDHDEGEEHDEEEEHGRLPNENGAAIHIIAPADGDVFQSGDQIIVEVEMENFDTSQEGYHWHVYVNGSSWGMIVGGNTDAPLTGVEPGEHEISVYLGLPSHEEYEDGDSIHVTVEE
jgi:ABC-type Zn2+ transport system substrate-binding protein/surface adhesin